MDHPWQQRIEEITDRPGYPTSQDELDLLTVRLARAFHRILRIETVPIATVVERHGDLAAVVDLRSGGRYRVALSIERLDQ